MGTYMDVKGQIFDRGQVEMLEKNYQYCHF